MSSDEGPTKASRAGRAILTRLRVAAAPLEHSRRLIAELRRSVSEDLGGPVIDRVQRADRSWPEIHPA